VARGRCGRCRRPRSDIRGMSGSGQAPGKLSNGSGKRTVQRRTWKSLSRPIQFCCPRRPPPHRSIPHLTDLTMASSTSEAAPLLPSHSRPSAKPSKPSRSVTFNPQVSTSSPPRRKPAFPTNTVSTAGTLSSPFVSGRDGPSQPMLSALNSKLRRRNSSGAPLQYMPQVPASKIGPQRTTRTAQKLKLLPNPENEEDDEESGREVYSQFTRIKDPTARRDAARLGKDDRAKLPRVTAYCTASSYKMDDLMRFLKGRAKTKSAAPKLFDECLYSPYRYRQEGSSRRRSSGADQQDEQELREAVTEVRSEPVRRFSDSAIEVEENAERRREDLIDFQDPRPSTDDLLGATSSQSQLFSSSSHPFTVDDSILPPSNTNSTDDPTFSAGPETRPLTPDFDTTIHIPEIFLFEYGVVVLWGFTLPEEQRFLREISKFEQEKLGKDDVQTEEFNFYYTREYQARIYNDFISLKKKRDYMTKLAISHALAQSTKVPTPTPTSQKHIPSALKSMNIQLTSANPTDVPLRRPPRLNHNNHLHDPGLHRAHRPHRPHAPRNQHANRRALHPAHQHPPPGQRAGCSGANVGGAAVGARLPGCEELSGDGSAG